MATLPKQKRLLDAYRFAGFRAQVSVRGVFGDSKARIVTLVRGSKKRSARRVAERTRAGTTAPRDEPATCRVATRGSIWNSKCDEFCVDAAAR